MTDFVKDNGVLDGLSLSDVSEVDPKELEHILQSVSVLDKKYYAEDIEENFEFKKKNLSKEQSKKEKESISNFIRSSEEEENDLSTRATYIFKEPQQPLRDNVEVPTEMQSRRMSNSADWLGLKDSPRHSIETDQSKIHQSGPNIILQSVEKEETNEYLKINKAVKPSEPSLIPPKPVPAMAAPHSRNKNKGILMNELFGELKLSSEEPPVKFGLEPSALKVADDSEKDLFSYTPSTAITKRNDRKPETASASNPRGSSGDQDFDWLSGPLKTSAETLRLKHADSGRPKTANSPVTSPPLASATLSSMSKKDSKVPDWLDEIVRDSSQKKKETITVEDSSKKLPDWLEGTPAVAQEQQAQSNQIAEPPQPKSVMHHGETIEGGNDIISKLASVQTELAAAMSKRTENLQIYMQELMHEAKRVSNGPSSSNSTPIQEKTKDSLPEDNKEGNSAGTDTKQVLEELRNKDNLLYDLEVKVNKLEMQNEHLEMKIQNMILTHEMEVDSIKKGHGFEISAWETRLERLKKSLEEATAEYEQKIARLKDRESELITEHKERISKMEEERLSDLNKLREFHLLAIEQAASFTMSAPSGSQTIRLPLRGRQRPKDEVELSERESLLMEKERQIEVLKAILEEQKKELDDALEVEKIRREDKERESRRQATEARLREELRQAEAKREREQLDSMSVQIKIMRDEALKEQGEIAKEKLELAAERARLEATYSIQGRTEGSIPPLDIMQARAEVEAALETARQAKEGAEMERRRQAEMRQSVEQITWEQKEMDLRLENRERHVGDMLKGAEKLRNEGLRAIEEAKAMKEEMEEQQREMKEQLRQLETKERVLAKERLEIAKEKIELDRRKTQLQLILPELNPAEELTIHPPRTFIDPKAVIMRLKAEKELESFMTTRK